MSILGLFADMYWDAPDLEDEEEDAPPAPILTDLLTVLRGVVWFTAADLIEEE